MSVIQLDWTLLVGAGVFLLTLLLLNKLLFKPLFQVLDERRAQTSDLREQADEVLRRQQALLKEYQEKVREARQAGYRASEELRNRTLKDRQRRISEARAQARRMIDEAVAQIQAEFESARGQLSAEAEKVAEIISSRLIPR